MQTHAFIHISREEYITSDMTDDMLRSTYIYSSEQFNLTDKRGKNRIWIELNNIGLPYHRHKLFFINEKQNNIVIQYARNKNYYFNRL